MPTPEGPEEYLATHEITQKLKRLGVTDEQLASIRFRDPMDFPFQCWSIVAAPDISLAAMPFLKDYCTLKWLILDDPPLSRDRDDAWTMISLISATPLIDLGLKTREIQSARARKPRGKLEGAGTMAEIIQELAAKPEHREATAGELWGHFFATLRDLDVEPMECPAETGNNSAVYEYNFNGKRKKISFHQFSNILSKIRRVQKSV